jgi:hypothetical protein
MSVRRGESVGNPSGRNGAGKSTLLKVKRCRPAPHVGKPSNGAGHVACACSSSSAPGFDRGAAGIARYVFLNGCHLPSLAAAEDARRAWRRNHRLRGARALHRRARCARTRPAHGRRLGFAVASDVEPELLCSSTSMLVGRRTWRFSMKCMARAGGVHRSTGATLILVSHSAAGRSSTFCKAGRCGWPRVPHRGGREAGARGGAERFVGDPPIPGALQSSRPRG